MSELIRAQNAAPWSRLVAALSYIGVFAVVGLILWAAGIRLNLARFAGGIHAPNLGLLAEQPLVVLIHLGTALLALGIGVVQLIGVKGTTLHRVLGWTWVAAMATTAVASLFIRQINPGHFSFIHLLSGYAIIALPMGIFFIRRGNVQIHARMMTGLFVGGLLLAGLLTFIPGRLMWRMFFG